jgi:putative hydrolase of the HAD superfamily
METEIQLRHSAGKKAIIFDLDNTIYPVSSIGAKLFKSLFQLISESGEYKGELNEINAEILRRPFQFIANDFSFSERLKSKCLDLFLDLTYDDKMEPFEDYKYVRKIPCKKFLVTLGFSKLQNSKIFQLNIKDDFDQIIVIDPIQSELTKKDIFQKILNENNYNADEVLVVGDDLNSEIKAARELGIDTVLYDHNSEYTNIENQKTINNFKDLHLYIK